MGFRPFGQAKTRASSRAAVASKISRQSEQNAPGVTHVPPLRPLRSRWFTQLCLLFLLTCSAIWPTLAQAANECPTFNVTVAAGGSVQINGLSCSVFGIGLGGVTQPAHGTATYTSRSSGVITYTNTSTAATDQFTFEDDLSEWITVNVTIGTPTYPPIAFSPTTLPAASFNVAYSQTLTASGGDGGPYTYLATAGTLPTGMSDTGGVISGTPTETGTFAFTMAATDGHGNTGSQDYVLTVNGGSIVISPATAPTGNLYSAYSLSMSASGGVAPYTYAYDNTGTLPPGINFSNGVFSGTPTAITSTSYAVKVTDANGASQRINYTLTIAPPSIVVSPSTLSNATQNVAYSQQLSASGGQPSGSYSYSHTGSLPAGVTLSSSGLLSGTPTGSGTFNFSVTATDSSPSPGPYSGTRNYSLTVDPNLPTITTASLAAGTVGVSYTQTIAATGGTPPYAFSVVTNSPPPGLTLAGNGTLSGTATSSGSFAFTVKVTDAASNSSTQSYTLVMGAPTITVAPATLPAATLHVAYSQSVIAQGGTSPYTYSVTAGSLPTGLSLASDGSLSGSPGSPGSYNFTVTATDSTGGNGPYTGSRAYSVTVSAPTITLSPVSLPAAGVGTAYSQSLSASGGSGPYSYAVSAGSLPAGVSLSSTGVLSGTPTAGGSFNFTVTATDANTNTGSQAYALTVNSPTLSIAPTSLPAAADGAAYTQGITASGGTAPYAYSITSGSLPPGMSVAADGTLSGTPTGVGTFNFVVQAQDSSTGTGPFTATRAYSLSVSAPALSLAPGTGTLNAGYATTYSQVFVGSGGVTPYSYSLSGSLPTGLTWNAATATISGTPTQAGSFPITVTLTDSSTGTGAPFSSAVNYTLVVATPTIGITPVSLPVGATGAAYPNTQLIATGGQGPFSYVISSGSLPAGISLSGTGVISGTPTAAGVFNISVKATDANGYNGTQAYSLSIGAASVALNPASLPAATAEAAYSQSFSASGGTAPYAYAVSSGALPAGLSLNAATGALSGTPTAAGSFTFSVQVTDSSTGSGAPFSASRSYTLSVNAPTITVTPVTLTAPQVGAAFSQQLTAQGGDATYTFALGSGSLPAGLSLGAGGLLSGTPTAAGSYSFAVTVTDGLGFTGTQNYSVTVTAPTLVLAPASLPAATAEATYSQSFTTTGGTAPYAYAVNSGALPAGLSLNAATGALSGTPTAAGSFTFSVQVTDSSSGTGAPFSASHSYTLVVNAPAITLAPASLPTPQAGVAYSQQITASGGNGSYTFAVTGGSLPAGLSLSTSGLLAGTPSAAGNFSFTITATDGLSFTGSQAYTLSVGQPRPIGVNDTASTTANAPVTIAVTTNDSGPITSIALGNAPGHGTASISGLNVVYTPASNYYGNDSLTYTATGPGGTSAATTVAITVTPLSVPHAAAQSASVLAGKPVTIHAAAGATGGPFTGAAIVTPPSEGTVAVSGTDIVFTPATTASGKVTFTYTLSNAFGTSAAATITVTVNPLPLAISRSVDAIAGVPVLVELTTGASGGPFTAASVVSVSPSTLGTASISAVSGGYQLRYVPNATASGTVAVSFTLANAYATSAPGIITIAITPRSDPTKDAEVMGLLGAQTEAMRRFATTQIDNFQQRLEAMHGGAIAGGQFDNGISLTPTMLRGPDGTPRVAEQDAMRRYIVDPAQDAAKPGAVVPGLPSNMAIWTGGAISFGSRDARAGTSGNGFDFHTSGLSAGSDYRVNDDFAFGGGLGYGHDSSDIGHHGTRSTANSYSVAFYASYHPSSMTYLDGLAGYQSMSFDSRRFVTDDGSYLTGHRHANQFFASISTGYEYRKDAFQLTPYGRLDLASGTLDGYMENGGSVYALSYRRETVKTTTGSLGLRMNYQCVVSMGTLAPQLRLEYQHDFQGSTNATLSYADLLSGPIYRTSVIGLNQNRMLFGIGANLQTWKGLNFRLEYQTQFGTGSETDRSILLNLQKKF